MKIKSYTELSAWQKAHELTLLVYRLTERFPNTERFGIVAQVRRSAAAVPANIAQGFGRGTTKELLQSLRVTRGELEEARYFMMLSRDLKHISLEEFKEVSELCDSTGRLINALGRSLKARLAADH